MNVILCGMMGSGKTAVAKAYSRMYGVKLADTDKLIVKKYGEISEIFAQHGEGYFRDLETEVCKKAAKREGVIISLGGGAVLRDENVAILKKSGKIIYLRTRPETIIKRLEGSKDRPLLNGDLKERVYTILNARAAIYEKAADEVVDTDDCTPAEIAKIIKEKLV